MFGTITLGYSPSEESSRDANLTMSFSSEATIPEMLKHFENFLRALEYPLDHDSSLTVVSSNVPDFSEPDYPIKLPGDVFGERVPYYDSMSNSNSSIYNFSLGQ